MKGLSSKLSLGPGDSMASPYYKFNMNLLPRKKSPADRSLSRSKKNRKNRFKHLLNTPEEKTEAWEPKDQGGLAEYQDSQTNNGLNLQEIYSETDEANSSFEREDEASKQQLRRMASNSIQPEEVRSKSLMKDKNPKRVSGRCFGTEFDIDDLIDKHINVFPGFQIMKSTEFITFYNNGLQKVVIIFEFGVVIFWNILELDEDQFLKKLAEFVHDAEQEWVEKDILQYVCGEKSKIGEGKIVICTNTIEEKISHSYAMAQSLKLAIYEAEVENSIDSTKAIPKCLAETGQIKLSKQETSKMIGNLFMLRNSVNLQSDMLDTPDYFWDIDKWEATYLKSRKYFDLDQRLEVLNNRLDIIKELYDMLNDELHNKHATKLEWIVIGLIVIEVVIEVVWNIIIKEVLNIP